MRALRARLSGLALPTYVLDIPGAHGKVPIGPEYLQATRRRSLRAREIVGVARTSMRMPAQLRRILVP